MHSKIVPFHQLPGPATAREHANVRSIQVLRGANVGAYGAGFANTSVIRACDGFSALKIGPVFGEIMATQLLTDGKWVLPDCPRCKILVLEALSIRASTDPADICTGPTWRKDDPLNKLKAP